MSVIVRLDDACPTMRHATWARLEAIFDRRRVTPIVGVIPTCEDPNLDLEPADPEFWTTVRRWRDKGWAIALHGLHHVYHPHPTGAQALVPFHAKSEFVGRPLEEQQRMLSLAMARFKALGIDPTMFMAPSHSFDLNTVEALRKSTDIEWITDGISFRPFTRFGLKWLPQQIATLRPWQRFGVWTVCLHPNGMNEKDVERFDAALGRHRKMIVSPDAVMRRTGGWGLPDYLFERLYWLARSAKEIVKRGEGAPSGLTPTLGSGA